MMLDNSEDLDTVTAAVASGSVPRQPPPTSHAYVHDNPDLGLLPADYRLSDDDAQRRIDQLDEELSGTVGSLADNSYSRTVRRLRNLCKFYQRLPTSCILQRYPTLDSQNPVGLGGYSDVFRAVSEAYGAVAVKRIRSHVYSDRSTAFKAFSAEAVTWKHIRHPNVIPFRGVFTSPTEFSIVSDWMAHGDIVSYIKSNAEAHLEMLILDIFDGLRFIHGINLVHGDLKGTNILINNQHQACLADFGFTTLVRTNTMTPRTTTALEGGSVRWMAPELLTGRGDLHPQTDVYAFGVVLWEILTCRLPFEDLSADAVVAVRVSQGLRPCLRCITDSPAVPDGLLNTITSSWIDTHSSRPVLNDTLREQLLLPVLPTPKLRVRGFTRLLFLLHAVFGSTAALLLLQMFPEEQLPVAILLTLFAVLFVRHLFNPTIRLVPIQTTYFGPSLLIIDPTLIAQGWNGLSAFSCACLLAVHVPMVIWLKGQFFPSVITFCLVIFASAFVCGYHDVSYGILRMRQLMRSYQPKDDHRTQLYVSGLPDEVTKKQLHQTFSVFGDIDWLSLHDEAQSSRSHNHCIVQFKNNNAAEKALLDMDGFELEGKQLRVERRHAFRLLSTQTNGQIALA
ncbi:hypothetical protein JAAARDRAFT_478861 [Jaapia argillacea MUCL 33604]|uniref:Protein kinase domain-containing protein n=1 Tax=Jaapia argillacea MUCL 33604 TaxID=933084 RepID=A0A067PCR7_9AGAM|nr:hypothetical protein JAAARDRAFT_478861 [Jaapia argillacea MUCL 33604]